MKTKKDTTLSLLREIKDLLSKKVITLEVNDNEKVTVEKLPEIPPDTILVDFPSITMKGLYEKTGNKGSDGKPLLYNINWYKDELFFTTEKTRPGKKYISKELIGEGLNWNEQEKLIKEKGGERINAAEIFYFLYWYEKEHKTRLWQSEWCWTSSRSSGGELVCVGYFDGYGAGVVGLEPGGWGGDLGSSFFRSVPMEGDK